MKINVFGIIFEHFATLRNASTERMSYIDIILFLVVPLVCAIFSRLTDFKLDEELYGFSVSIFSIFSALLFSAQVAMYSILRTPRLKNSDSIEDEKEKERFQKERKFLSEIMTNISYLILLSFICLIAVFVFKAFKFAPEIETAVLLALLLHFVLNLMMVVKRTHIAFKI